MKTCDLMILAGGTGGHVYPALAVAHNLQAANKTVRWMGTQAGLEARVVVDAGIDIDYVTVRGVRGAGLIIKLLTPFKLLWATLQAAQILFKRKPKAVLGMGGYVAGPGGLAAWLLRIPLIIHEQNAVAGLTNHYLSRLAAKVVSGFNRPKGLPTDTQWVGNPVRADIGALNARKNRVKADEHPLILLILGGSQGAQSLNTHLPAQLAKCLPAAQPKPSQGEQQKVATPRVKVVHQCGRGQAKALVSLYAAYPALDVSVIEFITEMADVLSKADLIVARAGAMTIAEIGAAGVASILVPYPFSAGDHQAINADYMVANKAAFKVMNDELEDTRFADLVSQLLADETLRNKMSVQASKTFKPSALAELTAICMGYLHA